MCAGGALRERGELAVVCDGWPLFAVVGRRFAELISGGGAWGRSVCRRGAKEQRWQRLKRVRKLDEVREAWLCGGAGMRGGGWPEGMGRKRGKKKKNGLGNGAGDLHRPPSLKLRRTSRGWIKRFLERSA